MKKILCLILLSTLIFTACTKKAEKSAYEKIIEKDYITVGVKTDVPPFGFINKETGENIGFDVDIAKNIAETILGDENKVKFVGITADTRIESITSSTVDMVIATMTVTPQRMYFIDFSIPYYVTGQTAIVKKDSNIYNFADLRNKNIAIVVGTTAEQNTKKVIPSAEILIYKKYEDAYNALLSGEADAFINDDSILASFLYKHKDYRILKNRLSKEPYAIGIKKEENSKLKEEINFTIEKIKNDGTLKELEKKWQLN